MDTALTSSGNITITFPDDYSYKYIMTFYYAELNSTANVDSRIFYIDVPTCYLKDILLNPDLVKGVFTVYYWELFYTPGTDIVLYQGQTVSNPLGPIANALETFEISTNPMATMTNNQDGELLIWL
jgi:hypothetical protein